MLRIAHPAKMSPVMIRSASLLALAFAWTLGSGVACAQDSASEMLTRLDRLEAAIRQLTGAMEQLQYRNQQLEQQVRRMQEVGEGRSDAPRPPSPSAQRPSAQYTPPPMAAPPTVGSAAPVDPSPSPGRRADVFDPALNPNAPGSPRALGSSSPANEPPPLHERPPGADAGGSPPPRTAGAPLNLSTLATTQPGGAVPGAGELPPPPPRNSSATGALQATLPPGATAKDEYDLAYGYVMHKDYALAADTFRTFLRQYPSDRLAPEAQYWLGESLFQQQQYRDAAESFLAVSTKYETTARAPEALFRLGQSLAALGEKEAACASLGEVLRKYPRASQNVKQSVEREQRRDHC